MKMVEYEIIENICQLYDTIPRREVISWNTMIIGYNNNGFVDNSLTSNNCNH